MLTKLLKHLGYIHISKIPPDKRNIYIGPEVGDAVEESCVILKNGMKVNIELYGYAKNPTFVFGADGKSYLGNVPAKLKVGNKNVYIIFENGTTEQLFYINDNTLTINDRHGTYTKNLKSSLERQLERLKFSEEVKLNNDSC